MKRTRAHHSKRASRLRSRRGPWLAMVVATAGLAAAQPVVAQVPAPRPPAYNRYQAEQEAEVGRFYLRKGRLDAAISRFLSAIKYQPNWAEPHLYLGEAYERNGDSKRALDEYREYLKIVPYAKDAKKIQKRVDRLSEQIKSRDPPVPHPS